MINRRDFFRKTGGFVAGVLGLSIPTKAIAKRPEKRPFHRHAEERRTGKLLCDHHFEVARVSFETSIGDGGAIHSIYYFDGEKWVLSDEMQFLSQIDRKPRHKLGSRYVDKYNRPWTYCKKVK